MTTSGYGRELDKFNKIHEQIDDGWEQVGDKLTMS